MAHDRMKAIHHTILCDFMNNIGFMVLGNHHIPIDPRELRPFSDPDGNVAFVGYVNYTIATFRATKPISAGEEIRMCRPSYICRCPLCSVPPPPLAALPLDPATGSAASVANVDGEEHREHDGHEDDDDSEEDDEDEESEENEGTDVEHLKESKGKAKANDTDTNSHNGEGSSRFKDDIQIRSQAQEADSDSITPAPPALEPAEPKTLDPLRMNPTSQFTGNQQQKKAAESNSGGDTQHVEDVANNDGTGSTKGKETTQDKKPSRRARLKEVWKRAFGKSDKPEGGHHEVSHNKDNQTEDRRIEDNRPGVKRPGMSDR
ncbi:hypothetical protein CORC01_11117 [Colletotrichum orchidophilum]|uniref:SET domain-containing protein n=1 Tax=Colletotrichum orchidophilum TaxID=1209926 RepID=A0A1G4AWS6_9PEZI|nr:uncharacterized protein CORC01_11117 [Colletotrichum orchidophilum]OHE93618.1 hypothetical protein CORC01_11117 [Colletotrichum orchidophilum]